MVNVAIQGEMVSKKFDQKIYNFFTGYLKEDNQFLVKALNSQIHSPTFLVDLPNFEVNNRPIYMATSY